MGQIPTKGNYSNRETYLFNVWIGSCLPLNDFVRLWVGGYESTKKTPKETLELIRLVEDMAKLSNDAEPNSDAWRMLVDMNGGDAPVRNVDVKGFRDVDAKDVADSVNEMFDLI